MNNTDKGIYSALKFFSDRTQKDALDLKKRDFKKYSKSVNLSVENSLHRVGYIHFNNDIEESAITDKGLEQLRILEDLKIKGISLWISTIAVIISLIALAKSMGWI